MNEHDLDRTSIEHDNGFTMVNIGSFEPRIDCYCNLSQCEHVFYSKVLRRGSWPFVVRYDPRGRPVKYNLVEEYDDAEEQLDVPNIGGDVLEDDIIENDDMDNPFNVDFELDDTPDKDSNEEEDKGHLNV